MAARRKSATDIGLDSLLQDLSVSEEPDHAARNVQALWDLWQYKDGDFGTGVFAAFEALATIGVAAERHVGQELPPTPDERIEVPWWAMKILVMAWDRYRRAPEGTSLGQSFKLESRGQGRSRKVSQLEKVRRDLMIALAVVHDYELAKAQGAKKSYAQSIGDVAKETSLGSRTVRRAYQSFGERARRRYSEFKAPKAL